MMAAYYSMGCDTRELFMGYDISKKGSFEKYLNKYYINLLSDYKEAAYLKDRFNNNYRIKMFNNLTEIYYSKILDNRNIDYFSIGVNHIRYNLYKF